MDIGVRQSSGGNDERQCVRYGWRPNPIRRGDKRAIKRKTAERPSWFRSAASIAVKPQKTREGHP
jgi:hypothetical protein